MQVIHIRNDKVLFFLIRLTTTKHGPPFSPWTRASLEVVGRHIAPVKGLAILMRISWHTVGSGSPYLGIYQMHGHKCCKCSNFMHKCVHGNTVSKSEKLEALWSPSPRVLCSDYKEWGPSLGHDSHWVGRQMAGLGLAVASQQRACPPGTPQRQLETQIVGGLRTPWSGASGLGPSKVSLSLSRVFWEVTFQRH